MDKTININLGGSLFQVDEEAFTVLRDYIQAINKRFRNTPGGPETIEDIESRIAEIFRSQKGLAGIITRLNVESMIAIIGKPEDFETETVADDPVTEGTLQRRLYRNPDDAVISGVCGGLGAYLNTDPVIFRILFILFALLGGTGVLIYFILWIAVPSAFTDAQKKEMYGKSYFVHHNAGRRTGNSSSGFNEILRAFGNVFYFIFRAILVFFGVCLVIMGFLFILSFFLIFVLKIPGAFSHEGIDFSISYLPNMLDYIFSPAAAPWIWALSIIVFILPLIALIYWGVRMIFWFRIRDGIFNLMMFIVWVIALATLSIMIFNEGVSFAENATSVSRNILKETPDTLHIVSAGKIDNINFDHEFTTPDDSYSLFMADSTRNLYIKPRIRFRVSEDNTAQVEVKKTASGRNRREANNNADAISYNYNITRDTLFLDEYFMVPSGRKWSADYVSVTLNLPEKTVLHFDKGSSGLVGKRIYIESGDDDEWMYADEDTEHLAGRYWIITDEGLRETGRKHSDR